MNKQLLVGLAFAVAGGLSVKIIKDIRKHKEILEDAKNDKY